ncbi:hypothetical protein AVEN_48975-1 [Araneus ventricosus]|uniref:Uncharacterized protein n=1 Tax=Araneus ventricosus TaxID=182803 RepID=A0A4Y2AH09_ARAVE|nr:hypothetical protein AVEN_48975-1 [Araneus ventricosus]
MVTLYAIPFLAHPFRQAINGRSTKFKSIRYRSLLSIPYCTCISSHLQNANPSPLISSRVRKPHPPSRIYTGHISAFMVWQTKWSCWIFRLGWISKLPTTPLHF